MMFVLYVFMATNRRKGYDCNRVVTGRRRTCHSSLCGRHLAHTSVSVGSGGPLDSSVSPGRSSVLPTESLSVGAQNEDGRYRSRSLGSER